MTTHEGTKRPQGERVEVFASLDADPSDRWHWRYFDSNGEEIDKSSEGYTNRSHAIDQAVERNKGVRVFMPGLNTDQSSDASEWTEVATDT